MSATAYPTLGALENAYILPSHPIHCVSPMMAMTQILSLKNSILGPHASQNDIRNTGIIAES